MGKFGGMLVFAELGSAVLKATAHLNQFCDAHRPDFISYTQCYKPGNQIGTGNDINFQNPN